MRREEANRERKERRPEQGDDCPPRREAGLPVDGRREHRQIDTITPTAVALGLTIDTKYSNSADDIAKLANDILTKSEYAGAVILICWHHGTIPALATALKGTGAQKWVGTGFDRVWLLDYSQGTSPPIQQFGQQLLFTDEKSVPTKPW